MPLGELHGIHPGSEVIATGSAMRMPVGNELKSRVLDGLGKPIDGRGPIVAEHSVGLNLLPPHPLKRQRIRDVRQGPDGLLYLLTDEDDGVVLRIEPAP